MEVADIAVYSSNPVNRIVLSGTVKRMGFSCRIFDFDDGIDAHSSLIIVDCPDHVPEWNPVIEKDMTLPCILLITSGNSVSHDLADHLMHKPIIPEHLEGVIRKLLESRN